MTLAPTLGCGRLPGVSLATSTRLRPPVAPMRRYLTPDECRHAAREGRRQDLVLAFVGVAYRHAQRAYVGDPDDARSAALEGLCYAAKHYDPEHKTSFRAYAGGIVISYVLRHINRYVLRKRLYVTGTVYGANEEIEWPEGFEVAQ